MLYAKSDCIDRSTKHICSWERASIDDVTSYKANIYSKIESCIYDYDVIYCNDIHCNNDAHRAQINEMCSTMIMYPFFYPPAQRLYLERDHNVKLYQDGTKKSKIHLTHHSFCIVSGLRLKNRWLFIFIVL